MIARVFFARPRGFAKIRRETDQCTDSLANKLPSAWLLLYPDFAFALSALAEVSVDVA